MRNFRNSLLSLALVQLIFLFGFVFLLSGCAKHYSDPVFSPEHVSFEGIHPADNGNNISLIVIHGMCDHGTDWVTDISISFADSLGMEIESSELFFGNGYTDVSTYKTILLNKGSRVSLYSILYSPVTRKVKHDNLCKDVSEDTEICPLVGEQKPLYRWERAGVNGLFKNYIMNDCLADAIIYLGETGETIRDGVRNALIAVHDDRSSNSLLESPLFLISQSLGSKILRDSLLSLKDNLNLVSSLTDLKQVFLIANQIPLLNLGDNQGSGDDRQIGDIFDLLISIKGEQNKDLDSIQMNTKIVSFTDPNDILSYTLNSEDYGKNQVGDQNIIRFDIVNVIISNGPTYFGKYENPLPAHLGYLENKKVINLIICGSGDSRSENCGKKSKH